MADETRPPTPAATPPTAAAAAKPAPPPRPAAPAVDLAGKTTTPAAGDEGPAGPGRYVATGDTPRLDGRGLGCVHGRFCVALAATGRFMFPQRIEQPPSTRCACGSGWRGRTVQGIKRDLIVRTADDIVQRAFYVLSDLHASGLQSELPGRRREVQVPAMEAGSCSPINFEAGAPRPLERMRVALADDGQILSTEPENPIRAVTVDRSSRSCSSRSERRLKARTNVAETKTIKPQESRTRLELVD